jgi:hypothetical protein
MSSRPKAVEKVAYVLGAGFSAPLGLPLISNFISIAKDLHTSDPERFHDFREVFSRIDEFARIKHYANADLLNVEELLSLEQTESFLNRQPINRRFVDFIIKVIEECTPEFSFLVD